MRFQQFIPAIFWFIISLVLLCLPGSNIPKYPFLAVIHADKWVHICMFFLLCFLFCYPFTKSEYPLAKRQNCFLLIALAGIAYGTIMEFVQKYWIPGRSFELLDIAADSAGSLLALVYWRVQASRQG